MLQIANIQKKYTTGTLVQTALDDVSISLRDNEFVAILGPSGSGKTTLLNIIGGLDRYDNGDLIINGISTKQYKDRDWDSYRNHSIGFVFQSYNLIPHQSVLANVELALTISGISRKERKKLAKQALEKVGLGDQLHKKPNQMSGGQMQRVAIARALVNNPEILLADEPTGALDSETSIQVMELLKEVAKDRLVVMVTHNPELAEQYANRIIKLRDGKIKDDTNPYVPAQETQVPPVHKNMGKASMSFLTSLSLSFNNLKTKKGRTLLTSFAGSIGIIGIALILALSSGVNKYIADMQKETMTSYPITLSTTAIDLSSMMGNRGNRISGEEETKSDRIGVYADNTALEIRQTITSSIAENDLTAFKKYLDNPDSEIRQYLGENGVVYTYDVNFNVYSYDSNGTLVNTNMETDQNSGNGSSSGFSANGGMASMLFGSSTSSGAENFSEMMKGSGDNAISAVITDSYDVLYGEWADAYDEVVLVLNENNSISSSILCQLGFITENEYKEITDKITNGEEAPEIKFDYEDVCNHEFYLVPACDTYAQNEDGTFSYIGDSVLSQNSMLENAVKLKVVGVVRPIEGSANATLSSAVGYTSALTDYVINRTNESPVVLAQEASSDINVLNGMAFQAADVASKIEDAKYYISNLNISNKAALFQMIMMSSSAGQTQSPYAQQGATMDETTMAAALDQWLLGTPDETILVALYDQYITGSSYEDNMVSFGKVSYDAPSSISIYADSFEDKDAIAECIKNYNKTADSDSQITYTDYIALLTTSLTSIVDVISYVLIAFVAVSLIVSCIMIGIITHISVLERTKEIGILRALGASKHNISQVFNAETFIIGLFSGMIGVGISALLIIPINAIIASLVGDETVRAILPIGYAVILVVISMIITIVGGLLPAKKAAKKDPVIALRTE